jgi:pyruvate/2-oxoglutarate/acetoin dehydrogenase E1 component
MPELTYREAVRDALSSAMRTDDDVFIMGEDIAEMGGSMGVTQGMLAEFGPERVRNTPISEIAIVGTGIGAAMQGMRPVVEIMYQDFLTLSMEQLVNQAAKHRTMSGGQVKVPLTIRTQGGAGWSPGAQHAQQLEGWFVHVPGLKVVFASTPTDVRGLLWSAIYDDNPVIFFEHRTLYGLKEEGYISDFNVKKGESFDTLVIQLKYGRSRERIITDLKRVSKPGRRVYAGKDRLPRVLGGMGVAILSTSNGLITSRTAEEKGIGGEVVCFVW